MALPQISFTMGSVNREAVAYLFTGDTDGDGVPDACEQYYYGTLANGGTSDTDGDGRTLAGRTHGGTSPIYGNSSQEGGVSWADSALVTVNLAGFPSYTLSSVPAGTVNQLADVPNGTVITTPDMTQATFGGYWESGRSAAAGCLGRGAAADQLHRERRDRVGSGVPVCQTTATATGSMTGFEQYYYGTLSNGAASDTDGDGKTCWLNTRAGRVRFTGTPFRRAVCLGSDSAVVVANLLKSSARNSSHSVTSTTASAPSAIS